MHTVQRNREPRPELGSLASGSTAKWYLEQIYKFNKFPILGVHALGESRLYINKRLVTYILNWHDQRTQSEGTVRSALSFDRYQPER